MDRRRQKAASNGPKQVALCGEVGVPLACDESVLTNAISDNEQDEVNDETDSAADAAASELEEWFTAARFGDLPMLSTMARKEIINAQDTDGSTALFKATSRNRLGACTLLLAGGADPSIKTNSGETALHMAARWGYSELARLLIDAGASAYDSSSTGETPFGLAKLNRKRKVLAIILGPADPAPKRLSTQGSSAAAAIAQTPVVADLPVESVDLEASTTSSPWSYCSIQ